jgi:predicted secreted protein
VALCSNPTTGFRWGSPEISDPSVVEVADHEFVSPVADGGSALAGGAGEEVWTFRALKPGEGTIGMTYGRPWQRGAEPTWRFLLTVVVAEEAP